MEKRWRKSLVSIMCRIRIYNNTRDGSGWIYNEFTVTKSLMLITQTTHARRHRPCGRLVRDIHYCIFSWPLYTIIVTFLHTPHMVVQVIIFITLIPACPGSKFRIRAIFLKFDKFRHVVKSQKEPSHLRKLCDPPLSFFLAFCIIEVLYNI